MLINGITCATPQVIFRASRSNNFYLWLLLIMLFLCTLPVAYAIVWLEPSWHCGPFSDYARIFHVMTQSLLKATPESIHWVLSYIASPGVVIPLLVLLILVIYYLVSLSSSLREAVTDLRTQMRRERDAERLKTRQKKEEEAAAAKEAPPPDAAAQKIIAQWRKAVPFAPNKSNLPQTLAKEAVDKRRHQSVSGVNRYVSRVPGFPAWLLTDNYNSTLDKRFCVLYLKGRSKGEEVALVANDLAVGWDLFFDFAGGAGGRVVEQQRAGPTVPPPQPTAGRQVGPVEAKTSRPAALAELVGCDGSDLDISDSLPNDNCSPVLTTGRGVEHSSPPQHQPVIYAVVKKKEKKKTSPPRVVVASSKPPASNNNMTEAPRSPGRIPLIRISQTESVEQADKNAPILDDPPITKQVKLRTCYSLIANY